MNLLSKLTTRAIDASTFGLWTDATSSNRQEVNEDTALKLTAIWSAVGIIADSIASMPLHAYRSTGTGRARLSKQPRWADLVSSMPNPYEDRYTWIHRAVTGLCLPGNAYMLILDRDSNGYPNSLVNLSPSRVEPVLDGGRMVYVYESAPGQREVFDRYTATNQSGRVLHVKFYDNGAARGLSPIDANEQAISAALAAQAHASDYWEKGGMPPGIISVEGRPSPEAIKALGQWWDDARRGKDSRHRPAVMSQAKFEPITLTPEQAQLLQTRQFTVNEIARIYRVPAHLLADTSVTTWGSGIEEMNRHFLQFTLLPYISRLEAAFNMLLPRGSFVKFDPSGILRGDIQTRYQAYATGIQNGFLNRNEVRAWEDLPAEDGLDSFLVPLNLDDSQEQSE